MDIEKFKEAKKELLKIMVDGNHCAESISAVRKAKSITSLIKVMGDFRVHLRHQIFPPVDWCRKWFQGEEEEINALGCYLDQQAEIQQGESPIFLLGDCFVSIHLKEIKIQNIICYGNSVARLYLEKGSMAHILLHEKSKCIVEKRGELSRLRIVDKREKL